MLSGVNYCRGVEDLSTLMGVPFSLAFPGHIASWMSLENQVRFTPRAFFQTIVTSFPSLSRIIPGLANAETTLHQGINSRHAMEIQ